MKTLSLLIAASSFSLLSCAQNIKPSEAPAVVLNAFTSKFPRATDVEWEKKGSHYEVEFETGSGGRDHKMLIDSTGKVIFHKQEIRESDLTEAVKATLTRNFPGYRLDDIEKTENNGILSYKLEVKKGREEWKLVLDAGGKMLEKVPD